ncbi:hypothetical protein B0H16DRAFT_297645 [Mycena metata]|uniref:Uncharacterized protein n=1 Tax=Mycena metata TaxID=1033252 RepID=A0AAD7KFG8_9AGAR|nr:hypothetical protein B0H16DRAFT_297645 [Mycena metata]
MLKQATKQSLTEVLSLVQKTVLNAASELEDEAQSQVARLHSELNVARSERDEALTSLHAAQIAASKHENELAQMRATVENLQREVVHWKEQAKNWQDHYTRVEQDRCGLSTELLTLSRSALTESPPKHYYSNSAPNSHMKRSSTSSNRPPAYKSAIPPSPSESDSPLQSASAPRNPRTPASKPARQQPASARSELPPYHSTDASTSASGSGVNRSGGSTVVAQQQPPRSAKAAGKQSQVQTPSQAPRQIFVRRVHAVVHVKEEEGDDDLEDEEEEQEVPDSNVRLVKRRGSGLMVQDDDDRSASGSEAEGARRGRDEESGDELMMDSRQEIYGGVHPVLPTPQPTLRLKRTANVAPQAEATPTKRRRVSDAARVKVPAKKK